MNKNSASAARILQVSFGLGALIMLAGPRAHAVVDIQTIQPTSNSTYVFAEDAFLQEAPRDNTWNGPRLFVGGQYNVVNNPLVEFDPTRTDRTAILVGSINTLDLTVGAFVRKDIEVSVNLPLNYSHVTGQDNAFGLGDTRVQGKIQIPSDFTNLAFAVIPEIYLPSGNRSLFLSNGAVGFGILGAFEADLGPIRGAINLGYRHTSGAEFLDINYQDLVPWSVGIIWPLALGWAVESDATGAIAFPINRFNNPSELYFGGRYQIQKDLDVHAGFSIGGLGSGESGDTRLILGVRFQPQLTSGTGSNASYQD